MWQGSPSVVGWRGMQTRTRQQIGECHVALTWQANQEMLTGPMIEQWLGQEQQIRGSHMSCLNLTRFDQFINRGKFSKRFQMNFGFLFLNVSTHEGKLKEFKVGSEPTFWIGMSFIIKFSLYNKSNFRKILHIHIHMLGFQQMVSGSNLEQRWAYYISLESSRSELSSFAVQMHAIHSKKFFMVLSKWVILQLLSLLVVCSSMMGVTDLFLWIGHLGRGQAWWSLFQQCYFVISYIWWSFERWF